MTDQWMPKDKTELMSAIEREGKLLLEVVEKLTDKQMTNPDAGGWSPKDNLAHLTEWMKILMGYHMDKRPSHEVLNLPEKVTKDWDFHVINEILFKRNKERAMDDVMNELKQVYSEVYERLNAMSFDDLMQPRDADDPEKLPILLWVLGNTTEHFLEHRETIERGIKEN
ncbi:MAG: ClbS/DfsB family four-helix bundle protein [Anaerolineales bacterium]|nr:ClbS/DfsB family four-helix bundle protein [Anaerolineales bacterium]